MRSLVFCLAVATASLSAAAEEPKEANPVHVLVVTGVDYTDHLWQATSPAICKVLEADKRFEARIVEDSDFLASPAVANYDVFLHFKSYKPLCPRVVS